MQDPLFDKKLKSKDKKLNSFIKKTAFVSKQSKRYTKISNLLQSERSG